MDIRFTFQAVDATLRGQLVRRSVWMPLLGRPNLEEVDLGWFRQADALLDLWRLRAATLSRFGWPGNYLQYVRNCLPSGVRVEEFSTWYCKRSTICPWCWGREVSVRIFDDLVLALSGLGALAGKGSQGESSFHLALLRSTVRSDGLSAAEMKVGLFELRDLTERIKRLVKAAGAVGAVSVAFLEPSDTTATSRRAARHCWKGTVRMLAVIPASTPTSPSTIRLRRLTRSSVSRLVSRLCRYPVGLIRNFADGSDSAEACAALLKERGRFNLVRRSGILWNNRADVVGAEPTSEITTEENP